MQQNCTQKIILALLISLFPFLLFAQISIPSDYYGINAWMPDSSGTVRYYGKLHEKWKEIGESKPQIIRIGGIGADRYFYTHHQLLELVDSIQSIGATPIVQVPVWGGDSTATYAASIVQFLNTIHNKNIKYWSIGNEPNHAYDNAAYGLGGNTYNVDDYANDVRAFSIAMKTVDPTIKILAGELAWYYDVWIDQLLQPGGANDISGNNGTHDYIDYLTFHRYPFSQNNPQTKAKVIEQIAAFENVTADLKGLLQTVNTTHSRNAPLQFGLTEININTTNPTDNNPTGLGSNSFLAGQWWADMLLTGIQEGAQFMTFWSAIEGGDGSATDNGYISHTTGKLKPTYYQFQMCAQNMNGTLYPVIEQQDSLKVYAAKDDLTDQWRLLFINYNEGQDMGISLRMDDTPTAALATVAVNVDAGLDKESMLSIPANSTTLVELNSCGSLLRQLTYTKTHAANNEAPQIVLQPRAKKVFAHYLPWYDANNANRTGWCYEGDCTNESNIHYSNKPLIGEYSQYDATVLEYHILTAHAADIDGFIINLNPQWSLQKELTLKVLDQLNILKTVYPQLEDFKIIISYDNGTADAAEIQNYFTYIHDEIYQHPSYKDLIFVDEITGEQVLQAWSEGDNVQYYQTAKALWACENLHLMIRNPREYDHSDGNFGWINYLNNDPSETTNWGQQYFNDFDWGMARQEASGLSNRLYTNELMMGMAYPGFNDENVPSFWNGGNSRYIQRQVDEGETMALTWDTQINWTPKRLGGTNAVLNPWTQIITWNDWPEGTSIEPATADTYGYTPLKTSRNKIAEWKESPSVFSETCLSVPHHLYLARQENENAIADQARDLFMQGDCEAATDLLNSIINPDPTVCLEDITIIEHTASSYCATDTITSSAIINSSENIEYRSTTAIILVPGFYATAGANFLAEIETCCTPTVPKISPSEQLITEMLRPVSTLDLAEHNLVIHPNPVGNSAVVTYELANTLSTSLEVLNSIGQIQWTKEISGQTGTITLSTDTWASGFYIVQLRQGKIVLGKKKIVKNR